MTYFITSISSISSHEYDSGRMHRDVHSALEYARKTIHRIQTENNWSKLAHIVSIARVGGKSNEILSMHHYPIA